MTQSTLSGVLRLAAIAVPLSIVAISEARAQAEPATAQCAGRAASDKPLLRYQQQLLDLAFETASALPHEPHIKNRSRAQEAVVAVCLELDQPWRAVRYADGIDNWRRGAAYADVAAHFARGGDAVQAAHYLVLAKQDFDESRKVETQDWRLQLVQAKLQEAQALLDRDAENEPIDLELSDADFDAQVRALDELPTRGSFEQITATTKMCAALFGRCYASERRRTVLEDKIKMLLGEVPRQVRIERLIELGGYAVDHGDQDKARALAEEARQTLDSIEWRPEDHIALAAEVAKLRWRAGAHEPARREVAVALAMFEASLEKIADVFRGGALRPVAEAYFIMGDEPAAQRLYARAVETAVINPNSRPRAEDLAATCRSMIQCGFEPPPHLFARMVEIRKALNDPW